MTDRKPRAPYLKGDARLNLATDLKTRYEAGASVRQLAEDTGRSYGNVAELLRLAGTEMRPKGFQPKATVPEPLTPEVVNAIVRDMDDPRYPSRITVYCDDCGVTNTGEYMVSSEMTSMQRLAVARKHLVGNEGWRHDAATGEDFCPKHAGADQ